MSARSLPGTGPGHAAVGGIRLRELVIHLSAFLDASHAFVAALDPADETMAATLAYAMDGRIQPDFTHALEGTPSEEVVQQERRVHPRDVQAAFPEDPRLTEMGLDAYVAVPLRDSEGRVLGVMAVMDRKPLARPDEAPALLATRLARRTVRRLAGRATLTVPQGGVECPVPWLARR